MHGPAIHVARRSRPAGRSPVASTATSSSTPTKADPSTASTNATSGAPMPANSNATNRLNAASTATVAIIERTTTATTAHAVRSVSSRRSSCQIIVVPLQIVSRRRTRRRRCRGARSRREAERARAWIAVGLTSRENAAMRASCTLPGPKRFNTMRPMKTSTRPSVSALATACARVQKSGNRVRPSALTIRNPVPATRKTAAIEVDHRDLLDSR
jgi:hypothetical protein